MFDKFGIFDSAEELNRAAAAQLGEGDTDALFALAQENGIDREDAQDYANGDMPELCTPLMAALGKLQVEEKDLEIAGILADWVGYIRELCQEDPEMARAVRRKNKELKYCITGLIAEAFSCKVRVSEKIVKETYVMHNGKKEKCRSPLYLGIPNAVQAKEIIRKYYLEEQA